MNQKSEEYLANFIFEQIKNKFRYINGIWYEFVKHRWQPHHNFNIEYIITTQIVAHLNKISEYLNHSGPNIVSNIKTILIDKISELSQNMNSNINLICFTNGVFDLESMTFRDGRPSDNITLTTGYDYVNIIPQDTIDEIHKFLDQLFPGNYMKSYFMRLCATCLSGNCNENKLNVLYGMGPNGKTTILQLLSLVFGEYFRYINDGILETQNSALSENYNGIRILAINECNKILPEKLNELLSNKPVETRCLYGRKETWTPQYKLFTTTNKYPTSFDKIRIIPCVATFVDNPTNRNEYEKDITIHYKFDFWRQAFMQLLIHKYYPEYKSHGLIHIVTKFDTAKQFVRDYIRVFQHNDPSFEFMQNRYDCNSYKFINENYKCSTRNTNDVLTPLELIQLIYDEFSDTIDTKIKA